ncbi:hypothetical protein RAS1_09830 [Phycisphaerae bacterium RAS1]|nr:hypothetical protein RAS1_09830 [Phycisphaerae bacterium RAS1]
MSFARHPGGNAVSGAGTIAANGQATELLTDITGEHLFAAFSPFSGPSYVRVYNTGRSRQFVPGDMNCDGATNALDITAFILALQNPGAYVAAFPVCYYAAGDMNGDGVVNVLDINAFVTVIAGG